jgi:DEAD/DEAH box helicase domain-containing protein
LPFLVMSDSMDIGSTVDLANTGAPTIFLYDKYPGGVGFAQRAYEMVEEVFRKALDLITACECADGCPSCVGSPLPPHSQLDPDTAAKGRIPDKEGALIILHELLELEPYIPKPKPVGEYPPASGDSQEEAGEPPPFTPLPETMELRIRKQLQNLQVQKGVSWSGKGKKTE